MDVHKQLRTKNSTLEKKGIWVPGGTVDGISYILLWKEGRKVEVYKAAMEWDSVENDTAVFLYTII